MDAYVRNKDAEFELICDLIDHFNFNLIPVIVDEIAQEDDEQAYLFSVDSLHDIYEMKSNVRKQLMRCMDVLAEGKYTSSYIDANGTKHEYYMCTITGQFETTVTFDPETNEYNGEIKFTAVESSTY